MNIRKILSELINGNHLWDYNSDLMKSQAAKDTKELVDLAHKALAKDTIIPIHVEMHGGLFNDVTCPIEGVTIEDFVFYTNNNDFEENHQRAEQIDILSKMISQETDADRIETYSHLIDKHREVMFVKGVEVDVLAKTKETIEFYGCIVDFRGTIVSHDKANGYYSVEDQEGNVFSLKVDDISLAEV